VIPLQVALEDGLASFTRVAALMQMRWSWPIVESIHFIGLTLLFGCIAAWDLRLIGVAKHVPITAFHRLIPLGILGFVINAASGVFFLITYPDQYVYNQAFHVKLLCIALAGLNVAVFYATQFRRVDALGPGQPSPLIARLNGWISLALWMTIIVCGRMITFFRPTQCRAADALGYIADCIVR